MCQPPLRAPGHLARDCFHQPGAKTYDLLPSIEYLQEQDQAKMEAAKQDRKAKKAAKKQVQWKFVIRCIDVMGARVYHGYQRT